MKSNIFAFFLQSLCSKLGTVTGLNLAENCRAHLPQWLNYLFYALIEAAIIVTYIAEVSGLYCIALDVQESKRRVEVVIGSPIALNLLLKVPLIAGCAIKIVDVLIILILHRPEGSMEGLGLFEGFVTLLVLSVVVFFATQLSHIKKTSVRDVFPGDIPSSAIVESDG